VKEIKEFLALSDMHLRFSTPRCRLDENWMDTQRQTLKFVADTANSLGVPVFVPGDIFNSAIASYQVINLFIDFCKSIDKAVYILPGNHDLPEHSMENLSKSSIGVLLNVSELTEKLKTFDGVPNVSFANFGEEVTNPGREVLLLHFLVFKDEKSIPYGVEALTAQDVLDTYPWAKLIITGDGHSSFVHIADDGRTLINPGHMNVQKSNELDHPMMYYVSIDENKIKSIKLPENFDMVTDDYIREKEKREEKVSAFVELIKKKGEISLSFEDNIEDELVLNKKTLGDKVVSMVYFLLGGSNGRS
jgi:hypothetical protein